jgi:glycosyltransferase involved in cell wall biosynthesis
MKLSIITINYNNANGLRKTIESVISQTSPDFEYIVIDGGSKDGSVDIIKKYTDKIAYWVSEPDAGIYHAMNKGILKAKGEYCQFLNSGDTLASNKTIENMLKALPDCSIFYGNMIKQLANGKTYRDKGKEGQISMLTFYKGTINHSPAFIKRSLFEKYGMYDEKLKIVSDWKFYFISVGLHNEPVKYVDLDVTSFDMSGISNTNSALDKQERRKVLEEYLPVRILSDYDNHWQNIDQATRINRYAISRFLFWLMDRCLAKFERISR